MENEMTRFTLFHLPSCPFCIRVRRAADRLGIELDLVDISTDRAARQRLLDWRGRATVPVLEVPRADGSTWLLPESADIVAFLEDIAVRHAA